MSRTRTPATFLLLLGLVACRREPPPQQSFFFADEIGEAVKDFDEARFRSFRKDGSLATHVTMDDREYRFSLVPPVPSRLSYDVAVPEGATLDFDIGVSALGAESATAPVTFAILVADEREEKVFEETVRRRFANQWFRRRVDLSGYAGRDVTIRFETRLQETPFTGSSSSAYLDLASRSIVPAWGHPVLSGSEGAEDPRRPPMLLISIDCLRADHVHAYGHDAPTTPNLDALAASGLLFENVATVSTWTLPTHMSMLTGVMPTEHGLRRTRKRSPSVPYLPEILAREGYETLGIVSGLYLAPTFGYEEGFHVYRALIDEPAEALVASAQELLLADGEQDRPRFLFLHFFDAHWPYLPEDAYLEQVGGRPSEISAPLGRVGSAEPPSGPEEVEALKRLYDAEIAHIDATLGELFDALKRAGLYDRALIVVTGDHGEAFYEHELWQHSEVIYNEVTRVPLIVKEPGGASLALAGKRIPELVSQLNIFPTFLERLGLESPYPHAGLSALARGEAAFPGHALTEVSWEQTPERGAYMKIAVSDERYKYVATFSGDKDDAEFVSRLDDEELYDLRQDPSESSNIMSRAPSDIASRRADVRDFLRVVRERRGREGGESIVVDEKMREKLRALGYVQP